MTNDLQPRPKPHPPPTLLSVRSLTIMVAAALIGVAVSGLTLLGGLHLALSVLAGLSAAGATTANLHKMLDL